MSLGQAALIRILLPPLPVPKMQIVAGAKKATVLVAGSALSPAPRPPPSHKQEDVVDFEGDDEEELQPNPAKELTPTPDPTPADPLEVRIVGPWLAPPQTEASARVRLSLYFALCVKSRPMFAGLMEVFVTAAPAAQAGLMAELPLLAKAAAKGFGEAGVVGLMAAAPDGAKALVLAMLDLLVPREINKPSQELVAAVRRLRATRCTRAVEGAKMKGESGGAGGQAKVRA